MVQHDLPVGACQAQREDGVHIACQRGTRSKQGQEIGLVHGPELRILLGTYGCRGRLAREQRHFAEAFAWPQMGNRERIGAGRSGLLIMQQDAHLAGRNNIELPMPDITLQDQCPARHAHQPQTC